MTNKIIIYSINLQLFATQTTLLDGLSPEMKTFYDMTLIDVAGPELVHEQFGQKRPIPKNGGKTIEFRQFSPLEKALTPITEGVTPSGNSLTVTAKTATVSQYGDFITQSDVLELTSLDNTILEATKLLGRQAGLTLDTVVRNVLQSGTNVTYCSKISTTGAETAVTSRANLDATAQLTVDTVMQVVAKLRAQNAPTINGKYVAIIHPYVAYDLMRTLNGPTLINIPLRKTFTKAKSVKLQASASLKHQKRKFIPETVVRQVLRYLQRCLLQTVHTV